MNGFLGKVTNSHLANELSKRFKNSYKTIRKVSDDGFLNYIEYDAADISPDKINQRFKNGNSVDFVSQGMCTGVYKAAKVLRQLDWYYNNEVEFIIKMNKCPEKKVKYDSIGVTAASPKLTKEIAQHYIETGNWYEYFDLLPYMTVDGVNEKGIYAQSNVVEKNGITPIDIHPGKEDCCCSIMLVRYILDRVSDITDSGDLYTVLDSLHLYGIPEQYNKYNTHILVADTRGNARIIEFICNNYCIKDYPIITNFRTNNGFATDEHNMPIWSTVEYNGCGVERWETAARWLSGETHDFEELRQKLMYTNSYLSDYSDESITSAWITECLSDDLNVTQAKDYHDNLSQSQYKETIDTHLSAYFDMYKNRSRDTAKTWHTTHSSIYDLVAKTFNIKSQQNDESWNVDFNGNVTKKKMQLKVGCIYEDGVKRYSKLFFKDQDQSDYVEKQFDEVIEVEKGHTVHLSAYPGIDNPNEHYKGWSDSTGLISEENPMTLLVDGNIKISANYYSAYHYDVVMTNVNDQEFNYDAVGSNIDRLMRFNDQEHVTNVGSPYNADFNSLNELKSIDDKYGKISAIADNGIWNCTELTSANLSNATSIGQNAFNNCSKIQTINIASATQIKGWAMNNLDSLSTIILSCVDSVPTLDSTALARGDQQNVVSVYVKNLRMQQLFYTEGTQWLPKIASGKYVIIPVL